jgi:hypothetical protein
MPKKFTYWSISVLCIFISHITRWNFNGVHASLEVKMFKDVYARLNRFVAFAIIWPLTKITVVTVVGATKVAWAFSIQSSRRAVTLVGPEVKCQSLLSSLHQSWDMSTHFSGTLIYQTYHESYLNPSHIVSCFVLDGRIVIGTSQGYERALSFELRHY